MKKAESANIKEMSKESENFICIDEYGLMYSFCVENSTIKEGGKLLPEEGLLNNLSSLAVKKDVVIFGDTEGNLTKWNAKDKHSSLMAKKHSSIKKLKFAPGKENMLLLVFYGDQLEIFEMSNFDQVSSFKPNAKLEIVDADWCSSDKLMVQFSNGIIQIFNINFNQTYDDSKYLPSLSSVKSLPNSYSDFVKNMQSFKKFIFEFSNAMCDDLSIGYESFVHLVDKFYDHNDKLKETLKKMNPCLIDLIFNKMKALTMTNAALKATSLAHLSLYFGFSGFETSFWTLFAYSLDPKSFDPKFFDIIRKNSTILELNEFRQNEYALLKWRSEKNKNNRLFSDLLLCNENDLVFNFLLETDAQNPDYLNNYMK